jgi:hypothetical protein
VYATGFYYGTVDFDPGPGVDNHTSNGIYDVFLSKLDSLGNFQWAKTWGGSDSDNGYGVAVDGSGNAYVTGFFQSTVDFDPGPGVDNHTPNAGCDAFLSKFDSAGSFIWAKTWGGDGQDSARGVAVDGSGNAYVTGDFEEIVDFDPGPGVDNHTSNGNDDVFLSKFDSSGNFLWAKTWGGIDYDYGCCVAVDGSGNAYVTGVFQDIVDFDPGSGVDNHTSNGAFDVFLSKFDSSGTYFWVRAWGGLIYSEIGYGVAVDGSGNVCVTGFFEQTVDFDPGPGIDNHTSNGQDIFLSKFDSSGNFLWAKTWGGHSAAYGDIGRGVAVDGSGNVYSTGYFEDTVDFDPGPGVDNHTVNYGGIFLSKFDSSGNFIWAKTWGDSWFTSGIGVAIDGSGGACVTGDFYGTADFDPGSGVDNHTSNGDRDAFLSKFKPDGSW